MRRLPGLIAVIVLSVSCGPRETDVLIIGGGASGNCAAIQAGRMGVDVLLVEEGPWLGGMLSSARGRRWKAILSDGRVVRARLLVDGAPCIRTSH